MTNDVKFLTRHYVKLQSFYWAFNDQTGGNWPSGAQGRAGESDKSVETPKSRVKRPNVPVMGI